MIHLWNADENGKTDLAMEEDRVARRDGTRLRLGIQTDWQNNIVLPRHRAP